MNLIFIILGILLATTVIAITITNLLGYKKLNKTLEYLARDKGETDKNDQFKE